MHILIILLALIFSSCNGCETYSLSSTKCKPGTPSVGDYDKDAQELCSNRIDDNCDGTVNEGCECTFGDQKSCGSSIGECKPGSVSCKEDGTWPQCVPIMVPDIELCDLKDNNCNGIVDDGIPNSECWTGPDSSVFSDVSICKTGNITCINGVVDCAGQTFPATEICNGLDDNCDGEIDNLSREDCGPFTDEGACTYGYFICNGTEKICINSTLPSEERCNNIDDNCNGVIDEEVEQLCTTACDVGIQICSEGTWSTCSATQPELEECNGVDDDCNGSIDDGILCFCQEGDVDFCYGSIRNRETNLEVTCGRGLKECTETGTWGPCYFYDKPEEQCNNWDDDCDGTVDSFTAVCGSQIARDGLGLCGPGEKICEEGQFTECIGAVEPTTEVCDGKDNDCDGLVDENLKKRNKVDFVFIIDISGSMCDAIQALKDGISMYMADFIETEHRFALVVVPHLALPTESYSVVSDFVYAEYFEAFLGTLDCNGGGDEPYLDAMYDASSYNNAMHLNWRFDAYPYITMVGDEYPQTFRNITSNDVGIQMSNCQIGSCLLGDKVEVFVLTTALYFYAIELAVYNDYNRLIDIRPAEAGRYAEIFRYIFSDICR